MLEGVSELTQSIKSLLEILHKIGKVIKFITSPVMIWNWLVGNIYWLVVLLVVICIILHVCGHEKAFKWSATSIFVYLLVKTIGVI